MEGDNVEEMWESLKKGDLKSVRPQGKSKSEKNGSVKISGEMQIVKGKKETYTRRIKDEKKEDKERRSICV